MPRKTETPLFPASHTHPDALLTQLLCRILEELFDAANGAILRKAMAPPAGAAYPRMQGAGAAQQTVDGYDVGEYENLRLFEFILMNCLSLFSSFLCAAYLSEHS